jgi:hypothetical protein
MATLEALPASPEVEAQWRALAALALANEDVAVAARCAAALGDAARVVYLNQVSWWCWPLSGEGKVG